MPGFDDLEELAELVGAHTGAMLPGDGEPEEHAVEQVAPTRGVIQRQMEQAREGHRLAEEEPERGAYHGGPPVPDMGGVTMPADPRNLCGPFVPVPPDEVAPPMMGGRKMRVQSFDEAKAEIAEGRAELAQARAVQARAFVEHAREIAEQEAQQFEDEAERAERDAHEARSKA